jgi:hypothetical protein
MQLTHGEYVDAFANQAIDHGIALQHVADDFVVEFVAPFEEALIDLGEYFLKLPKCGFDRVEIEHAHIELQLL